MKIYPWKMTEWSQEESIVDAIDSGKVLFGSVCRGEMHPDTVKAFFRLGTGRGLNGHPIPRLTKVGES